MPTASISVLRHRVAASLLHLRYLPLAAAAASRHRNPSNVSRKLENPSKNFLRAKQRTVREFSSLSPVLSPDDEPPLSDSQAIGTVAAAQANFMRVIVQSLPSIEGAGMGAELLCVVKAVLKKIKRRVLVGDKVLVGSIDWVNQRGMIENVFQRRTEIHHQLLRPLQSSPSSSSSNSGPVQGPVPVRNRAGSEPWPRLLSSATNSSQCFPRLCSSMAGARANTGDIGTPVQLRKEQNSEYIALPVKSTLILVNFLRDR